MVPHRSTFHFAMAPPERGNWQLSCAGRSLDLPEPNWARRASIHCTCLPWTRRTPAALVLPSSCTPTAFLSVVLQSSRWGRNRNSRHSNTASSVHLLDGRRGLVMQPGRGRLWSSHAATRLPLTPNRGSGRVKHVLQRQRAPDAACISPIVPISQSNARPQCH